MKRQMIMASAALALLSATAGAQQWDGEGYTYRLKGCYTVKDQVRCDFTYTLIRGTVAEQEFDLRNYDIVTTDGQTLTAYSISVGGGNFVPYVMGGKVNTKVYKDTPLLTSVLFNASGYSSFKVLAFGDSPMNNVPIAKSAAALAQAAPAPAAPPVLTTPAPSAGVPTGFAIKLSNCKVNKGIYTCTATLTPTR